MKKNKKTNVKKEKTSGITLIALVVTVIVLLLLAGVSIAMLTGDNSLITQAGRAKEETQKAEKDEMKDIAILEEMSDGKGTDVEEVMDKNPGVLEVEEDSTKVINSIEDLIFFAYDVREQGNTYEGQIVKLGLSLDFNSSKSYVNPFRTDYEEYGYNGELKTLLTSGEGFKPIGITTSEEGCENKSFSGTFDGNGKIIYNLLINKNIEDNKNDVAIGLFGNNYGEIKKLGLENCNIFVKSNENAESNTRLGGINGKNLGTIDSCYVTGKIQGNVGGKNLFKVGGISGVLDSSGIIKNSYNKASLSCR